MTVALNKLNNVWIKGNRRKTSIKIKLYKSLVKSILSITAKHGHLHKYRKRDLTHIYHRKPLRKILNIRYPQNIKNQSLYRICQEKPLHYKSYRLAGVTLFKFYEETKDDQRQPCQSVQHRSRTDSTPKHSKYLSEITELTQDRKCWRGLTSKIEKAAEVSQTKNWDAKRQ